MEKDLTEKLFEELKKQGLYEQEDTIEDEEDEENESEGSNDQFCEIIC